MLFICSVSPYATSASSVKTPLSPHRRAVLTRRRILSFIQVRVDLSPFKRTRISDRLYHALKTYVLQGCATWEAPT
jgi:hypothetical protein